MTTFTQFCELHGLIMGPLAEGRWARVKTTDKPHHRNGAYKFMGDHGFVQNHATMTGIATWHADGDATKARPIDPALAQRRREEARAARVAGIRAARELWASGAPYSGHAYLHGKGLSAQGCHHLRMWHGRVWVGPGESVDDDWLLVPIYWRGRLISVQRISGGGIKRQMKDAPQKAGSLTLARPRSVVTVFVEGLATGLAIYQSIRLARVVVVFFADNLLPVIEEMKPTGSVVIAADNDHKTAKRIGTNPGIEKATNAASLIGAGVVWPTGIEGSDYADALKELGEGAPRRIEREILAGARYVMGSGP